MLNPFSVCKITREVGQFRVMDIFEDNYFDIIALPLNDENLCIQPSDYMAYPCDGLHASDELPSYTELTTSAFLHPSSSACSSSSSTSELEQFLIFDCDDSFTVTTFDNLPDQTLMCTDSCAAFLKESSEILRVNSLKIQQQDEVSVSSVEDVVKGGGVVGDDKVFYSCNFGDCSKTYSKPAHLRAHLRRHLGLKPYFCTFPDCSWKFSRSDELGEERNDR
jgi:uncharacterized Zn-finger protein